MSGESIHRQALLLARDGQWDDAHRLVQAHSDAMSCRIHACLHRQEGDLANAGYWYRRAGCDAASGSIEAEIDSLLAVTASEPS